MKTLHNRKLIQNRKLFVRHGFDHVSITRHHFCCFEGGNRIGFQAEYYNPNDKLKRSNFKNCQHNTSLNEGNYKLYWKYPYGVLKSEYRHVKTR
jgi:hypothetical protein